MRREITAVLCGIGVVGLCGLIGCGRDDDVGDAFTPAPQHAAANDQSATARPGGNGRVPSSQPDQPPASAPARSAPSGDPTVASFLGLRAPKPADWQWRPPENELVHTNYAVPGADGGGEATITIFFFGPRMGGSIQANIDRWQQQFDIVDGSRPEPEVTEFKASGMDITLVELVGAYQAMGDPTPTPNQLFVSAIVDAPVGRVFIRFVGDEPTVQHHRDAFMNMLENLEPIEDGDEASGDPGAPYAR